MADKPKRSPKRRRQEKKSRLGLYSVLAVVILLAAYVGVLIYSKPHVGGQRLRADQFVELIGRKRIKSAKVLDEDSTITGTFTRRDGSLAKYNAPYLKTSGSQSDLVNLLIKARVPTTIGGSWWAPCPSPSATPSWGRRSRGGCCCSARRGVGRR
jgi:hypothetical protein